MLSEDILAINKAQSLYCHESTENLEHYQSEVEGWQKSPSLQDKLAGWEHYLLITALLILWVIYSRTQMSAFRSLYLSILHKT